VLEEALAVSRALGDRAWEGRALNKLARLTFYEGDLDAARALHEEAIATVRPAGNAWDIAIALGDLGDVLHAQGNDAEARRHYAESLRLWLELGDQRGVAQGLEGFAILAAADARTERAVRLLGAARAIRERITEPNSPSRLAALERLLAAAHADLGPSYDPAWNSGYAASPVEAVAEAMADGETIRAVGGTREVAAVAGPTGGPDAARSSTPPAEIVQLTDREREVVELVANGLTNRRIADELIVSERTVEWHVSKLLSRLGLQSRAQLALWALDQGILTAE
jgi:DNA-binding CsgD family transcriptional regulator